MEEEKDLRQKYQQPFLSVVVPEEPPEQEMAPFELKKKRGERDIPDFKPPAAIKMGAGK